MASASAQRSQSASAGVSIARDAPEMPVRFELRGVPDVEPGYRVVVAGTWCDWDLSLASPMSLELDDDTGTRYWAVDVDIRADDTYEYKYAVTRVDGVEDVEDAKAKPDNRVLALQFSLARDVALVEVEDRWPFGSQGESHSSASPGRYHRGDRVHAASPGLHRELRATVRRLGDAVSAADAAAAEEEKRRRDAIVAEARGGGGGEGREGSRERGGGRQSREGARGTPRRGGRRRGTRDGGVGSEGKTKYPMTREIFT